MRGKGTTGVIISCLSNDTDYCRTFIDLKGAFDRVNGEVILYELTNLGVTGRLLYWIGDYLYGKRTTVCYQGVSSSERSLELGTPQGALFNVLMNRVAKEHLATGVTSIIYANNILLESKKVSDMQEALTSFTQLSQSLSLVINEDKTKFMCHAKCRQELNVNGKYIERVKSLFRSVYWLHCREQGG